MTYRILITGGRDWTDRDQVFDALTSLLKRVNSTDVVIVHGACKTGADKLAQEFCDENGIKFEAVPAEWNKYGGIAGPNRNTVMVNRGANICLAFWDGAKTDGSGTFDCLRKAVKAGIRVVIYPRM